MPELCLCFIQARRPDFRLFCRRRGDTHIRKLLESCNCHRRHIGEDRPDIQAAAERLDLLAHRRDVEISRAFDAGDEGLRLAELAREGYLRHRARLAQLGEAHFPGCHCAAKCSTSCPRPAAPGRCADRGNCAGARANRRHAQHRRLRADGVQLLNPWLAPIR